jgi:imidazolonepropionase-like amidohydrolase
MANEDSIRLMRGRNVTVVPTMSIYQAIADRISSGGSHPGGKVTGGLYSTLYEDVKRLYDGGLNLALGTDTMGDPLPFGKDARELQLYVEKVGLSPLSAITIGTLNGAKAMGRGDLGLIEAGMKADIIALERNPIEDIRCLQDEDNVKLVIKGGIVYKNGLL